MYPLNKMDEEVVVNQLLNEDKQESLSAKALYEFEYYKTKGTHHLMKKHIIPETMGGLSGGPVVDGDGKLVGIVSTGEFSFLNCGVQDKLISINDKIRKAINKSGGDMVTVTLY